MKKKKIIIAIIVFVIVFICICIIMRYLHRDDEFLKGANGNAMKAIALKYKNKTQEYQGLKKFVAN